MNRVERSSLSFKREWYKSPKILHEHTFWLQSVLRGNTVKMKFSALFYWFLQNSLFKLFLSEKIKDSRRPQFLLYSSYFTERELRSSYRKYGLVYGLNNWNNTMCCHSNIFSSNLSGSGSLDQRVKNLYRIKQSVILWGLTSGWNPFVGAVSLTTPRLRKNEKSYTR